MKPLGIKKQRKIKGFIKEVLRVTTMKSANFGRALSKNEFPMNEEEVDVFIKNRIRLWLESWTRQPLKEILKILNETNENL